MSKIHRIKIENIKGVGSFDAFVGGESFFLMAGNRKGKTTTARILSLFQAKDPSVFLKNGKKTGSAEVTLSDGTVLRATIMEGDSKLTIIDSSGAKTSAVKTVSKMVSELVGSPFSLKEFLGTTAAKRRSMALSIASGVDGIDALFINAKTLELKQTEANSLLKMAKTGAIPVTPMIEELAKKTKPDSVALMANLEKLRKEDKALQDQRALAAALSKKSDEILAQIIALQAELEAVDVKIEAAEAQVAILAQSAPTQEQIDAVMLEIAESSKVSTQIEQAIMAVRKGEEIDRAEQYAEKAKDALAEARKAISDKLATAKFPVPGMSVSETDVILNGNPFNEDFVSGSEMVLAAAILAVEGAGSLKFVHVDIPSMDKDTFELLLNWAKENDYQLCAERPEWDGGELRYEIIDQEDGQ